VKSARLPGRSSNRAAYLFAGPAILLIGMFSIIGIGYSFWISLHDYDVLAARNPFVGLENYRAALSDELFRLSLINTSYYVLLAAASPSPG